MIYSYKCPKCGWTGELVCTYAERDKQTCDNEVDVIANIGVTAAKSLGEVNGNNSAVLKDVSVSVKCGAKLEPVFQPSVNIRIPSSFRAC